MKPQLGRGPLPAAFAGITGSHLRVLAYHGVSDPATFSRQLDLLLDGFEMISLADLESCLRSGDAPPPRSVLITFDDGDRSVHEHALPLLRRAAAPAVVYVVTDLIDTDTPFWWDAATHAFDAGGRTALVPAGTATDLVRAMKAVPDPERRAALRELEDGVATVGQRQLTTAELRELVDAGVSIGNHTHTHPCLDRCDRTTTRAEIEQAHRRLTTILGAEPTSFAYPNGNLDLDAEETLRDLGYRSAFLFDHRTQPLPADPLRLSRLRVDAHADIDTFRLLVSGAHSFLHHRILRRR